MGSFTLAPEVLDLVAERFKALSEPARLRILNALRVGERTVSELMEETGLGQANVSKHLQILHALGFVERRTLADLPHIHRWHRRLPREPSSAIRKTAPG